MQIKKICTTCGREVTSKWYSGPTCAPCYQRNRTKANPELVKAIQKKSAAKCIDRSRAYNTKRRPQYKERQLNNYLKCAYGITKAEFDAMLLSQGGGCKICGRTDSGRKRMPRLVVDHCHETEKVRGLLCHPCNVILGMAQDSITTLSSVIEYLTCK